ncbi:AGE family epimerase/isomerase [Phycisphaera mikurensis]|uniref:Putative sugar epimerase n=1 Tax=Phycisphaera mikurensis (strain NBRC 102666 / KCTC 22515 / FYK2301M01) TaxID=1142394 RepID=I0IJ76_PHYMF|nr:AGE family epimerase/isomerase [Phycisphaera mikurensis]MBB6443286.1 mannobiose 2-epimerase [Phycisphaera mikurensis]BAM05314.1 putative sugar epimerase [Phycisphaera mikurensis NBRC 102666]
MISPRPRRPRLLFVAALVWLPVAAAPTASGEAAFPAAAETAPPAEGGLALPAAAAFDAAGLAEIRAFAEHAVDREHGGFHTDLDNGWTPTPSPVKTLVYQSRVIWTLAQAARQRPGAVDEAEALARHGLELLAGPLSDPREGGFFWSIDTSAAGEPDAEAGQKHLYGVSFAVYAAANAARTLGDAAALELAKDGFRWIERVARDPDHRGYREAFLRDGTPILEAPAWDRDGSDVIGTAYGFKSMNTHLHLMEAYAELHRAWPDPELAERLAELLGLLRDTVTVEPGAMNLFFTPDWRAVPSSGSYGHDLESAYLLLDAAERLGPDEIERTLPVARALADHAIRWGLDPEHGGVFDAGPAFGPPTSETKVWWAQAEAAHALLLMDDLFGDETPAYRDAFAATWAFSVDHLIDHRLGGWRWSTAADGTPAGPEGKANAWKGPYHTVRAMFNVADRLRARGAGATN